MFLTPYPSLLTLSEIEALENEVDVLNRKARQQRVVEPFLSYQFALEAYEKAIQIHYALGTGYALLNIGFYLLYIKGKVEEGAQKIQEANYFFEMIGHEVGLAWGIMIQASTINYAGEYEKSFNQYNKALEIFIKKGDKEGEVLTKYLLGNIYLELQEYDKAAILHEECLSINEHLEDKIGIANVLTSLANTYHAKQDHEKSIVYFQRAIDLSRQNGNINAEARALHDIGLVYETLGDYGKAIELVETALTIRETQEQKQGTITCCLSLGRLYYRMQDFDYAIQRLELAIHYGVILNAKPKLLRAYNELANIYKDLGDAWKALDNYEKYMEMKTAVLGEENNLQLKNIHANYETEKAKKEIEIEKLRNVELKEAYHKIEQQNRHIIDSIKYAKRIQEAILDPVENITQSIGYESFIFYQAKDIVSGDFYWYGEIPNKFSPAHYYKVIIAADCTGHGVPGAFMTVMGNDFLNDIVIGQEIVEPAQIIYRLDEKVTKTLSKQGGDRQPNDGMDIGVLVIDELHQKILFSGAKNPLYIIRGQELLEVKGAKFPIGSNQYRQPKHFENYIFEMQKGDRYYIATDGYQDQFGKDGKFMKRRFKALLQSLCTLPLSQQKEVLQTTIQDWQGTKPQTDDWLVIGICNK